MNYKIKHIYWFAAFDAVCPSTRYRGIIPLEHLKKKGVTNSFIYPDRSIIGLFKFLRIYFEIILFRKANSLIVIQKIYSNRFYANALKFLIYIKEKNSIYDIDDAEQYRQQTKTINFFLKNCGQIFVGSSFLMNYSRQFNRNIVLQTSPVTSPIDTIKGMKNEKIHLGWVGDFGNGNEISRVFSHKTSLYKLLFPALLKISYPIRLTLIGIKMSEDVKKINEYFKSYPDIEVNIPLNLNWKEDRWIYNEICKFDLGISLMVDHPFNRGKSAFKVKQYLVCGVPVLANDVGETLRFVKDNYNGFICNNEFEVIASINKVKDMNEADYKAISKNCLEKINEFSVERYGEILLGN